MLTVRRLGLERRLSLGLLLHLLGYCSKITTSEKTLRFCLPTLAMKCGCQHGNRLQIKKRLRRDPGYCLYLESKPASY